MGGGKNPWEQLSSGGIRTCGLEIASLKWFLLFFPPLCFLPHIPLLWKSQSPLSRGTVGVTCCHFKGKMEKCLKKDGKMSGGGAAASFLPGMVGNHWGVGAVSKLRTFEEEENAQTHRDRRLSRSNSHLPPGDSPSRPNFRGSMFYFTGKI